MVDNRYDISIGGNDDLCVGGEPVKCYSRAPPLTVNVEPLKVMTAEVNIQIKKISVNERFLGLDNLCRNQIFNLAGDIACLNDGEMFSISDVAKPLPLVKPPLPPISRRKDLVN